MFSNLDRNQKSAIWLLQIGTILEYFDFMLCTHMAVLLNELFFPQPSFQSAQTTMLFTAIIFCSTYIARPLGALLFGYIGDNVGRKATVILTSIMMAISCVIMAILPPYEKIGIIATVAIIVCRILQGVSSMGEGIGAEIYLTEAIKPPARYTAVSLVDAASAFGSVLALFVANLIMHFGLNWRFVFLAGAMIAVVGFAARVRLREVPEFLEMRVRVKKIIDTLEHDWVKEVVSKGGFISRAQLRRTPDFIAMKKRMKKLVEDAIYARVERSMVKLSLTHDVDFKKELRKNILAAFLMYSAWPVFFYFTYVYCSEILKNDFNYTNAQIINNNMIVSIFSFLSMLGVGLLSYKIHPLKIVKTRLLIFLPFMLLIPKLLAMIHNPQALMLMQIFCIVFAPMDAPAASIIVINFPLFKRFTYISMIYALSKIFIYIIVSFGSIYFTGLFDNSWLLFIMLPVTVGFIWAVYRFECLEKSATTIGKITANTDTDNSNELLAEYNKSFN